MCPPDARPVTTRRQLLGKAGTAAAGIAAMEVLAMAQGAPTAQPDTHDAEPFGYCFNTSTVRGQNLPLTKTIDIVAKAGYRAIEPWVSELEDHVKAGGTLADLRKQLGDAGISVQSAIGFAEWIIDGEERRKQGLERMRHDMGLVAEVGGVRIAAPPTGAQHREAGPVDLLQAAKRYHALLEVGKQAGVVPQVELWGFSRNLSRLGEVAFVAIESGHPDACILADVYHLYKGGSELAGLKLLNGNSMHVLHVNDYPTQPDRATIGDEARVFPGDGVAPLTHIFRTLRDIGYRGYLSLELFNRHYWEQDAQTVATQGLEKTRQSVRAALGG